MKIAHMLTDKSLILELPWLIWVNWPVNLYEESEIQPASSTILKTLALQVG